MRGAVTKKMNCLQNINMQCAYISCGTIDVHKWVEDVNAKKKI